MTPAGAGRALALAGLLAVLSACTASGTSTTAAATSSASPSAGASAAVSAPPPALQTTYRSVIDRVLPSVVEIRTGNALGSGVVLDDAGHVVTNAHVVGDATTFTVLTSRSATPLRARLVGTYPADDLAVIAVEGGDLTPATFADSGGVHVGDLVLAMGNPLGLSATVTDGIISAVGRTVSEPQSADSPGATLPEALQTSAAINPGNSGGALVDMSGQVVGIPTLAALSPEGGGTAPGIGFAIPSSIVRAIAPQLARDGKVTHSGRGSLQVGVTTVVDATGSPRGCGVVQVVSGGAAATGGVQVGDVVTAVSGTPTPTVQALTAVLAGLDPGRTVPLTVQRGGRSVALTVRLGELAGS